MIASHLMIALFLCFGSSLIPVPKRPPGIRFGADPALINFEVFCDTLCPYCAELWSVIESVINQFPTQVGFQLHFIALPSHTWAYAVARGVFAANSLSPSIARELVHGLYVKGDQNQFTASALQTTPESKVVQSITTYIASTYGLDPVKVQQAYNATETVQNTRIDFKYAFVRHIPGTPTIYVNGAQSELGSDTTLSDWASFIKNLL
jgi:predicted DsbA family dithiol-disulfide isomerase